VHSARAELTSILGLDAVPVLTRVQRWDDTMPRYTVGHRARVQQIRQRLTTWPGLAVAGSPYDGAAVPDCIGSGQNAVQTVFDTLTTGRAASAT
jgi:oxygen-dependent protoporphyrinogen oxidase